MLQAFIFIIGIVIGFYAQSLVGPKQENLSSVDREEYTQESSKTENELLREITKLNKKCNSPERSLKREIAQENNQEDTDDFSEEEYSEPFGNDAGLDESSMPESVSAEELEIISREDELY